MLIRQTIVAEGDRVVAVGPAAAVKVPASARLIDLGQATVLPGLIDAHTHMFNARTPEMTSERAMLIAVQNAQADLNHVKVIRRNTSGQQQTMEVNLYKALESGDESADVALQKDDVIFVPQSRQKPNILTPIIYLLSRVGRVIL